MAWPEGYAGKGGVKLGPTRLLAGAGGAWLGEGAGLPAGDEMGLDPIYREPETDEWQEAWIITEKILVKLRDEVQSHGAELQVVTLSNGIQVHPDPAVRGRMQEQLNVADLFYPDRKMETICQQSQIPVLILAPQLQAYAERHREYLHGFANTALGTGHWNSKGHEVAGKMIAESICNRFETP